MIYVDIPEYDLQTSAVLAEDMEKCYQFGDEVQTGMSANTLAITFELISIQDQAVQVFGELYDTPSIIIGIDHL